MTRVVPPILVLGIGNVLLSDDGVGVRVVDELACRVEAGIVSLPPEVELADGGTLGRDLLPYLVGRRALVIVDAADLGLPAGSVGVTRRERIAGRRTPDSLDPDGMLLLLASAVAAGALSEDVVLVGIQPEVVRAGFGLSPRVERAVEPAIAVVLGEVHRMLRSLEAVA